jgi:hypothetical protein
MPSAYGLLALRPRSRSRFASEHSLSGRAWPVAFMIACSGSPSSRASSMKVFRRLCGVMVFPGTTVFASSRTMRKSDLVLSGRCRSVIAEAVKDAASAAP